VIELLLVDRRIEMSVQRVVVVELLLAEIAHPVVTIKRSVSSGILNMFFLVPLDLLLCNEAVGVEGSNGTMDGLTVPVAGFGACTHFEVVGCAACRDKTDVAKWAFDICATVNPRVHMLQIELVKPPKKKEKRKR
jgi:hypothetical protein